MSHVRPNCLWPRIHHISNRFAAIIIARSAALVLTIDGANQHILLVENYRPRPDPIRQALREHVSMSEASRSIAYRRAHYCSPADLYPCIANTRRQIVDEKWKSSKPLLERRARLASQAANDPVGFAPLIPVDLAEAE
jgi:hypothetical protein